MFREGTRVVIVDERDARSKSANVKKGQKGTIGKSRGSHSDYVNFHADGDPHPTPWAIPASSVKRIRKQKK